MADAPPVGKSDTHLILGLANMRCGKCHGELECYFMANDKGEVILAGKCKRCKVTVDVPIMRVEANVLERES